MTHKWIQLLTVVALAGTSEVNGSETLPPQSTPHAEQVQDHHAADSQRPSVENLVTALQEVKTAATTSNSLTGEVGQSKEHRSNSFSSPFSRPTSP